MAEALGRPNIASRRLVVNPDRVPALQVDTPGGPGYATEGGPGQGRRGQGDVEPRARGESPPATRQLTRAVPRSKRAGVFRCHEDSSVPYRPDPASIC